MDDKNIESGQYKTSLRAMLTKFRDALYNASISGGDASEETAGETIYPEIAHFNTFLSQLPPMAKKMFLMKCKPAQGGEHESLGSLLEYISGHGYGCIDWVHKVFTKILDNKAMDDLLDMEFEVSSQEEAGSYASASASSSQPPVSADHSNDSNVTTRYKEKTFVITDKLQLHIKKDASSEFKLALMQDGKKVLGMFLNEETAKEIISNLNDLDHLITYLKTIGRSGTEIAEYIEKDIQTSSFGTSPS